MTANGATGTADVPWANVPQTLQANTLAASYEDTASNAGDYLITSGSSYIDTLDFNNGWTVEASFNFNSWTNWGAAARPGIVCKEGDNGGYPFFDVQIEPGRDQLRVTTSRTSPSDRRFYGTTVIETGKWYSIAVTYDPLAVGSDKAVKLYMKKEGDTSYSFEGTSGGPWSSIILNGDEPWSVGRGVRTGSPKGYMNGAIDEVRISDVVLPESAFLGTVPEPSFIIGGIALALLAFRRK